MKIGIFTFCFAHNYGALLQCYAMKELLTQMGHDVDVVGFHYKNLDDTYVRTTPHLSEFRNPIRAIRKQIKQIVNLPYLSENRNIWNSYEEFIKNVLRPVPYPNNTKYDAVICGSDQIWNPVSLRGFKNEFFGILDNCNPIRIAYAPSCGNIAEIKEYQALLIENAKRMNAISARETGLSTFLSENLHMKVPTVLDPSLIVDKVIYSKIAATPVFTYPYVLVYNKDGRDGLIRLTGEVLGKKYNCKVVEITTLNAVPGSTKDYIRLNGVSIPKYLALFRDAQAVVTDAFHGVAFSIVYNKQFFFVELIRAERIFDLFNRLKISGRTIKSLNDLTDDKIDYSEVNCTIEKLKEEAINYIKESLGWRQ